ncbi:MAG TPA: Abi-alpha family protein [Solimonas sp.]|nr:Abi-alpha family protein [Solimonas sp.]
MTAPDRDAEDLPPGGLRRYLAHVLRSAIDRRLDRLERWVAPASRLTDGRAASAVAEPARLPRHDPSPLTDELASAFQALLDPALDQTQEQSEHAYFRSVLGALVPDEALILSALSDGARHPMLCIAAGPWLGSPYRVVAENISGIGRIAGIQWKDMTPVYLGRLRRWGLIEVGAEDPAQTSNYEILETDNGVTRAVELAKAHRNERAVILRHTIQLSAAGQRFWAVCHTGRHTAR